jgi:hypothetical protein
VADAVQDSFATEARAFVAQWDRLKLPGRKSFGDIPDPEIVRPVIHQAEFICYQNDNPFRDFTDVDLWTMRLASSFLRWLADPGNPKWWDRQFAARAELDREDAYPWEFNPDGE